MLGRTSGSDTGASPATVPIRRSGRSRHARARTPETRSIVAARNASLAGCVGRATTFARGTATFAIRVGRVDVADGNATPRPFATRVGRLDVADGKARPRWFAIRVGRVDVVDRDAAPRPFAVFDAPAGDDACVVRIEATGGKEAALGACVRGRDGVACARTPVPDPCARGLTIDSRATVVPLASFAPRASGRRAASAADVASRSGCVRARRSARGTRTVARAARPERSCERDATSASAGRCETGAVA